MSKRNIEFIPTEEINAKMDSFKYSAEDKQSVIDVKTEDILNLLEQLSFEQLEEQLQIFNDELSSIEKIIANGETLNRLVNSDDFKEFEKMYLDDEVERLAGVLSGSAIIKRDVREDMSDMLAAIGHFRRFLETKHTQSINAKEDLLGALLNVEVIKQCISISKGN